MDLPIVSIIIPVYNASDFIDSCLQSVINQDYEGGIECILIDDRGTDDSMAIAQHIIKDYTGNIEFRILQQPTNLKQSAARNRGIREAKGEYIYLLDSDDWIDATTLTDLVELMQRHQGCQMALGGIDSKNEDTFGWMNCNTWKDQDIEYTEDRQWIIDTCAIRLGMITMSPGNKLMRRDFFINKQLWFTEGLYHEDEIWLVQLAKHLEKVAFLHKNNYHYCINNNSTTSGGNVKHYNDRIKGWYEIFKLLDKEFCPYILLRQIEWDTTGTFEKTQDSEIRKKLIGVKIKLLQYCPMRSKLRIIRWIIKNYRQCRISQ